MATRRSRIKGIANIPQRRKTDAKSIEESTNEVPDEAPVQNDELNVIEKGDIPDVTNESNNNIASDVPNKSETHKIQSVENENNTDVSPKVESTPTIREQSTKQAPHRRTFIKPLVNIKSLANKSKPKKEEASKTSTNLNQTPLSVQPTNKEIEISASAQIVVNLESENVPEPQSPTKLINRSRIKAVPRLTQRRISSTVHGSASESEDDTNKKTYKRIRTESACSTVSSSNENSVRLEPELQQKTRDFNTVIQRKCRRTEQSNKMAEARRNFINKFRNKEPDKHKLTMLDLIFYNPTTKPMSQKPERSDTRKSIEENPTNTECEVDNVESDEENHVPAPQIKIGANGEIVVDEQSLVIENKQTKKDRENLQNSEVVDGDFDTGYGIYKRAKRCKDWNKDDTLFFYKALNTLGSDFSLMVQLFPGRSRKELKMKFKKEEKINRSLVDKALTRPLQFNIKELKEEVKLRQKLKELERVEKEEKLKQLQAQKKNTILPYTRKGIKRQPRTGVKKETRKSKDIYSKIEKGIASVWESDSEEEKTEDNDKDEENDDYTTSTADLTNILKPTRYGRIPKQKTFTLDDPKVVKIREEHLEEEHQLEPGSLMIVCCQTQTGAPTFKVFMITGSQSKVPVILPPHVLSNLTKLSDNQTIKGSIPENNYTICHDDSNNRQIEVEIQEDFSENVLNNENSVTSS